MDGFSQASLECVADFFHLLVGHVVTSILFLNTPVAKNLSNQALMFFLSGASSP
jgi:hypothetical protein